MIWDVHLGFRIRILIVYPSQIQDRGVKNALDPGSQIRIRNTFTPVYSTFIPKKTGSQDRIQVF
jgi:hypothetical protein